MVENQGSEQPQSTSQPPPSPQPESPAVRPTIDQLLQGADTSLEVDMIESDAPDDSSYGNTSPLREDQL